MFNELTKASLDALKLELPQSILLYGPEGVGLNGAVKYITKDLQGEVITVLPEKKEVVDLENGTITIDVIRRLYQTVRTKGFDKVIVIDYAERMAGPAQNAFLKLLEEPNAYTRFILLTHKPSLLLPTVLSRVQSVEVLPINALQSKELLAELGVKDPTRLAQQMFIANGLPAELKRLQNDDYFNSRAEIVRDARSFVSGTPYERSKIAHKYKDDRQKALALLDDSLKLIKMSIDDKKDPSYLVSAEKILDARKTVAGNGNIRLQLSVAL